MSKGKPWTLDEEKLWNLVDSNLPLNVIAAEMKKTYAAVSKKCERLGLELVGATPQVKTTTSILMPKELPSPEYVLTKLSSLNAADLQALREVFQQNIIPR